MFSLDIEKDLIYIGKDLKDKNDKKIILKLINRKLSHYLQANYITQILKKLRIRKRK